MRALRKTGVVSHHINMTDRLADDYVRGPCMGVGKPPVPDTIRAGGMPVLEGYQKRVRCPGCGSPANRRNNGTIAAHRWYKPAVGWVTECPGVGQPPAAVPAVRADTPAQAAALSDLALITEVVNRLGGSIIAALAGRDDAGRDGGSDGDGDVVTEYATGMSGGSMNIRPDDPDIEHAYPLTAWIEHRQRDGGKVYRRQVIVVEDWEEVPHGE